MLVEVQVGQATVSDDMMFPAPRNVPAAQPVHSVKPVPVVKWPAGQSRQEVEPKVGWYLEAGQEVQASGPEVRQPYTTT